MSQSERFKRMFDERFTPESCRRMIGDGGEGCIFIADGMLKLCGHKAPDWWPAMVEEANKAVALGETQENDDA